VRRAAPDLPPFNAYNWAVVYRAAVRRGEETDSLDRLLALAPWRDTEWFNFRRLVALIPELRTSDLNPLALLMVMPDAERRRFRDRIELGKLPGPTNQGSAPRAPRRRSDVARRGGREGSIYKRASDGRWVGAVSIGAARRKVVYGDTRTEVAER